MTERVVLAYSGGPDPSGATPYLAGSGRPRTLAGGANVAGRLASGPRE
jgi:argininosuccinate synthase